MRIADIDDKGIKVKSVWIMMRCITLSSAILILGLLELCVKEGLCLRCMQCNDINAPNDCNTVTECSGTEQCVVEEYVTPNGTVLIRSGCVASNGCSARKRSSPLHIVVCHECCSTDFCNLRGCGMNDTQSEIGPKCFNCHDMDSPDQCANTEQCGKDESCGLIHSNGKWEARCVINLQCSAFAALTTIHHECPVCCSGELCNDRCSNYTDSGLLPVTSTKGVQCLQCTDVSHPFDCNTVETCVSGDRCYVKQYVTSLGMTKYQTGCMSTQRCGVAKRTSEYNDDSSITTCVHCCDGDLCNSDGCGTTSPPRSQRGPKCFSCKTQEEPRTCRTTKTCNTDEFCLIYQTKLGLWTSDCHSHTLCNVLTRTGPSTVCCKDDFCNNVQLDNHTDADQSTTNSAAKIPTHPTTVAITTKSPLDADQSTTNSAVKIPTHPTTVANTTKSPLDTSTTNSTWKIPTHPTTAGTTTTVATTTISPEDVCRHHNYTYIPQVNLCYKVYFKSVKWSDANHYCLSEGATLAIIDSREKWLALKERLHNKINHQKLYIGGKDIHHNNTFYWPNGNRIEFIPWSHNQPDGGHDDYLNIYGGHTIAWHDCSGKSHYYFMCTMDV